MSDENKNWETTFTVKKNEWPDDWKTENTFSWENPFTAETFGGDSEFSGQGQYWADKANARFRELLKEHGRKVWISAAKNPFMHDEPGWSGDTYEAVLVAEKNLETETSQVSAKKEIK